MGLSDTVSQLILVRGDTSSARAEMQKLRGVEKQAARDRLTEIEAHNKGIDAQIAKWSKFAVGVGAAVGAFKLAQASAKAYLEDVRLEAAAAGVSLDRLNKSTRNLVENDTLLALAGKAQHGVWKLNAAEIETVAKGTDVLAKRMGLELQPSIEKVTEAISKGQVRALKEFGIEAKDKASVLAAFTAAAKDAGKGGTSAAEKWTQANKKLADVIDDLKGKFGEFVVAMGPLLSAFADLLGYITQIASKMGDIGGGAGGLLKNIPGFGFSGGVGSDIRANIAMLEARQANGGRRLIASGGGATPVYGPPGSAAGASSVIQVLNILSAAGEWAENQKARGGPGRSFASPGDPAAAFATLGGGAGLLGGAIGGAFQNQALASGNRRIAEQNATMVEQNATMASSQTADAQGRLAALDETNARIEQFTAQLEQAQRIEEMVKQRRQSMLESIFGPVDQFNAYAAGFQILQSAAASAFDAWITGSQSLGQAIKKAIAEDLRSMAIQMLMESLKHLAYAAGAFAFGDFRGAGAHLKSAALFGAGAAAAGLAAKSMGAGQGMSAGGGAPSGTSAGGYIGGSGGGGGDRTSNTVIYVTGDAYRMSQAEREHRISDAARRGQQKRSRNVGAHE